MANTSIYNIKSVTTMAKASTQSIDTAVEAEGTSDDVKR